MDKEQCLVYKLSNPQQLLSSFTFSSGLMCAVTTDSVTHCSAGGFEIIFTIHTLQYQSILNQCSDFLF